MAAAGDLFNLWVWFEAMAVSSYLLVIFYREEPASLEAGMKYIIQSAAGSVLVLIGIALVLSTTGVLDISVLQGTVAGVAHFKPVLAAAGALFVIGFGVKVALVPLHTWLPDAHSQAPSGISAMLSGIVIEAGLIAMLRALSVTGMSVTWGVVLMVFGAVNILYGNLLALRQTKVKRLLAFSSLSHIGYMLLGLGIALQTGQALGAQGAFFHLFNHMLMKGLAFLAVGALMYALFLTSGVQGSHKALDISDLAGAAKSYPLAALALAIAVLGLGGLPPLAGFMSKWQIFVAGFAIAKYLDHGSGGLCSLEQRAFPRLLRAAGQYHVPRKTIGPDADRKAPAFCHAAFPGDPFIACAPVGLYAGPDGLAHRSGFAYLYRHVQAVR